MSDPADVHTATIPSADVPPHRRRWSRSSIAITAVAAVLVVSFVVAANYQIPYHTQLPGEAVPIEDLIEVAGAPEFPSDGEVNLTTVRVDSETTVLDAVIAWFDPAVTLVDDERFLGGRTPEERRRVNRELMSQSQEVATRVALEHLGYDVMSPGGALVAEVSEGSAADGVLEAGDVVLQANGTSIATASDLVDAIRSHLPGDEVTLVIDRVDVSADQTFTVTLGDNDGVALLGVATDDYIDLADLPFDVTVDSQNIGGPSAGLALTLSVLDLLTPGDLTGGVQVATTGTIDPTGRVGPIGGIEQKAHAVLRAGIDVFVVPENHVADALSVVGDRVTVVGVETLDEALEALAGLGGNALELALPPEVAPDERDAA